MDFRFWYQFVMIGGLLHICVLGGAVRGCAKLVSETTVEIGVISGVKLTVDKSLLFNWLDAMRSREIWPIGGILENRAA